MNYFVQPTEWSYFAMLLKSWTFMFLKLFCPVDLAVEYAYPVPPSWADPWVIFALLGAGLYLFFLHFSLKRSPLGFFALAWMGAFWLPVSNLWPLAYFAADRYLYAPAAGFFILAALLIDRMLLQKSVLRWGGAIVLMAILSSLTWQQNQVWSTEFSLWSRAVEVSPQSAYALNNLGVVYGERGDMTKAFSLVEKAAENSFYAEAQGNMARLYKWLGDKEKALYYSQRAMNPHLQVSP